MAIKLEQFSQKYQGFLEYPSDKVNDRKMSAILFDTYLETKYIIKYGDEEILTRNISKELATVLESDGMEIEKIQIKRLRGKKKLFKLPVRITKDMDKDNVECTKIKIIGNNFDSVAKKIELIKQNLSEYGIKPNECIRERKDLEEGIDDDEEDLEYIEEENDDNTILEVPRVVNNVEEDGMIEIIEKIDDINSENADKENVSPSVCPSCNSNNVKELLQTPNGNRMKCEDCNETFVVKENFK